MALAFGGIGTDEFETYSEANLKFCVWIICKYDLGSVVLVDVDKFFSWSKLFDFAGPIEKAPFRSLEFISLHCKCQSNLYFEISKVHCVCLRASIDANDR